MNKNLIYFSMLILFGFAYSLLTIEPFNFTNAQIDPAQEQIEPIPPSNNTNANQTVPIVISSKSLV